MFENLVENQDHYDENEEMLIIISREKYFSDEYKFVRDPIDISDTRSNRTNKSNQSDFQAQIEKELIVLKNKKVLAKWKNGSNLVKSILLNYDQNSNKPQKPSHAYFTVEMMEDKVFAIIISNQLTNSEGDGLLITNNDNTDLSNLLKNYPYKLYNKYCLSEDKSSEESKHAEDKSNRISLNLSSSTDLSQIAIQSESKSTKELGRVTEGFKQKDFDFTEKEISSVQEFNNQFKNIPKKSIIFFESKNNSDFQKTAWQLDRFMTDFNREFRESPRILGLIAISCTDEKLFEMCQKEETLRKKKQEIRDLQNLVGKAKIMMINIQQNLYELPMKKYYISKDSIGHILDDVKIRKNQEKKITELEKENAELRKENAEIRKENAELKNNFAKLEEKVDNLFKFMKLDENVSLDK